MGKKDQEPCFEILRSELGYDGFLRIRELELRFLRFDGQWSAPVERIVLEKGPAAAIVLFLTDVQKLVLVKQFRYPGATAGSPYLEELVAGKIDPGESVEEGMLRELHEESGFEAAHLESWGKFLVSPGYTTEVIHLYYAESTLGRQTGAGGGVDYEQEDLKVLLHDPEEVRTMLKNQAFMDAKTIIGLQQFFLRQL